ncbi:cytochrome P450 [Nonomuraea spiralis]|uniref:cytochrome P450 n=1 Tax=Nonomuraea TaxID=83681 RepID=UPI000F7ABC1C|nr:cytochrome P450 [Nonomuraea sp. WAC 01424]RSN05607.1 cytochrome P450 [Nonomuraea sp. WAC 01424]
MAHQVTRNLFAQVLDEASRPDPYPLYALLRETPVARQGNDLYAVSTYAEIVSLLYDPRISSDERKSRSGSGSFGASGRLMGGEDGQNARKPAFIFLDPPDHDRLRRIVMRHFTPERVDRLGRHMSSLVAELLDRRAGHDSMDVVDDLAYPLPVTVICELLGVPKEDEPRFHGWASALARTLDPPEGLSAEEVRQAEAAAPELHAYLVDLAGERHARPADDLLSALLTDRAAERMDGPEIIATMALLLIAGHETTVNLIANGMLTFLRNPDALARLRADPGLIVPAVEEVLRYDPPVQFRTRTTLADIEIAGVTIPQGADVALLLASGSRDPARFPGADRFDPGRRDNQHLGFGGGVHYCVGAPLARIEARAALGALVGRLVGPELAADPPPYRHSASLRGPERLVVGFDRLL